VESPLSWLAIVGGPVVAILLLLSLTALILILFKLSQFWYLRPAANARSEQLMRHFAAGEQAQLRLLCKGQRNGRVQLIDQTRELLEQKALTGDLLRSELFRRARLALAPLEAWLRPLEVIAIVAPLLGLFGTVLGMIDAFRAMEAAGTQVNPAVLSGGIWQALLTTAVGLAVAIPVTMIHSALERTTETTAMGMQNDIEQMLALQAQQQHQAQGKSIRNAS